MGVVYAGLQPLIGKKVAIKVLAPWVAHSADVVRRFISEARAVNQVGHRNIIDIFSFGTLADGRVYYVMEYLPGRTLEKEISVKGVLAYEQNLDVLFQVCDALHAAHEAGIVHRDLKPDNIFLVDAKDDRTPVKLLDFGIAKLSTTDSASPSRTRTGIPMGTPAYMSPEQCRGVTVDLRTDIYSLGIIMYRLFTGRLPFSGDSFLDLLSYHVNTPPPTPSQFRAMPPALEAIILRCLAKDPAQRFSTVKELASELASVVNDGPDASLPSGPRTVRAPGFGERTPSPSHPALPATDSQLRQGAVAHRSQPELMDTPIAISEERAAHRHMLTSVASSRAAVIIGVLAAAALGGGVWFLRHERMKQGNGPSVVDGAATPDSGQAAHPDAVGDGAGARRQPQDGVRRPTGETAGGARSAEPRLPDPSGTGAGKVDKGTSGGVLPLPRAPQEAPDGAATLGGLRITVNVDGATVSVDGKVVGHGRFVEVRELATGSHRVSVSHPDYATSQSSVQVDAGMFTPLVVSLERAVKRPEPDGVDPGAARDGSKDPSTAPPIPTPPTVDPPPAN